MHDTNLTLPVTTKQILTLIYILCGPMQCLKTPATDLSHTIADQKDNAGITAHKCWEQCICTGTTAVKRIMYTLLKCDAS